MATSLRAIANCIGITGPFSLLPDFYGFILARLPEDPTGARVQVSLAEQIKVLRGRRIDLNMIMVGSDQFTEDDHEQIDYSILRLRNIFRQVGVGVARIQHWIVTTAEANGLDSPTTKGDLEDLTEAWTVRNDGIDVFFPHNMAVFADSFMILGHSDIDGPCDKNEKRIMTGVACGLWGREQTSRTVAHEVGHYLGLYHNHEDDCPTDAGARQNLMAQSRCWPDPRVSIALTTVQGDDMKDHCSTKGGC